MPGNVLRTLSPLILMYLIRELYLLSPFDKWRSWGISRLNDLPKSYSSSVMKLGLEIKQCESWAHSWKNVTVQEEEKGQEAWQSEDYVPSCQVHGVVQKAAVSVAYTLLRYSCPRWHGGEQGQKVRQSTYPTNMFNLNMESPYEKVAFSL